MTLSIMQASSAPMSPPVPPPVSTRPSSSVMVTRTPTSERVSLFSLNTLLFFFFPRQQPFGRLRINYPEQKKQTGVTRVEGHDTMFILVAGVKKKYWRVLDTLKKNIKAVEKKKTLI